MRKGQLKKLLFVHLGLFATGYCGLASSHDVAGSLGVPFFSTDLYYVNCSTDSGGETDYLEFSIIDSTQTPGGGKLSVVVEGGGFFTQTGDKVRGDADWSPIHRVHAGNGTYKAIVHKLKEGGNKVYTLDYHCKSSTGAHTGTSLITVQNQ